VSDTSFPLNILTASWEALLRPVALSAPFPSLLRLELALAMPKLRRRVNGLLEWDVVGRLGRGASEGSYCITATDG